MEAASSFNLKKEKDLLEGLSPTSQTRFFWNSRKRTASGRSLDEVNMIEEKSLSGQQKTIDDAQEPALSAALSDRRKALFEPLEPTNKAKPPSNETLLPPPDFESASYPKGWLVGKKRKLVNVDVVESMRRIAVQEMNRKDREIDGLNEQLEEDARCLEHLQLQLLQERSKRAEVERENGMLQDQISMLMNMLQESQGAVDDDDTPADDS